MCGNIILETAITELRIYDKPKNQTCISHHF